LIEAARRIKAQVPSVRIVVQPAVSVQSEFARQFPGILEWAQVVEDADQRYDAMAAATLAIACSGTVTSEVAMQGAPMIVGYKTGWVTWAVARGLLYKKIHITLLNILNGDKEIVPEFVQTRLDAEAIAKRALSWLADPAALGAQCLRQREALKVLVREGKSAAELAADAILLEMNGPQRAVIGA
jgi:lipid-A-disaccharide synthase